MQASPSSSTIPAFIRNLERGLPQKIVFYGTSLTAEGAWTGMLLAALERKYPTLIDSVNTAASGEHSVWGLAHFDESVLAHHPDVLFLEFSINDSCERFGISAETSRANLEEMIARTREHRPNCDIILQTMNPVLDRPAGHTGHRPQLETYQRVWRETGDTHGLLVIDHMPAWKELLSRDEKQFRAFVPDGLHPAEDGYREIMLPVLLRALHLDNRDR